MTQATPLQRDAQHPIPQSGGSARLTVPGMGSDHCAGIVSATLERIEGVEEIRTRIATHHVDVRFDRARVDAARLKAAVERAGYEVAAVEEAKPSGGEREAEADIEERYLAQAWRRLWIAAVPATLIMILMMVHMLWVELPG